MAEIRKKDLIISGIPVCSGIAIGEAFVFSYEEGVVPNFTISKEELKDEVMRFNRAVEKGYLDLIRLRYQLEEEGAFESAAIISTHLEILKDPLIIKNIEDGIYKYNKNAEYIVQLVMQDYEEKFNKINDKFFRERFKDIQDVSRRIFAHLRNSMHISLLDIPHGAIIFSKELFPSDIVESSSPRIQGFVTEIGGSASHAAIIAKSKAMPYISNINFPKAARLNGLTVIMDGHKGKVIINPSKALLEDYRRQQKCLIKDRELLESLYACAAQTSEGHSVALAANVDDINDIYEIAQYQDVSVGLFRSENLFFNKDSLPLEEEQFEAYKKLVTAMGNRPVVIRTFDIGGDKCVGLNEGFKEANPFLGCRAIRFLIREQNVFRTQIRAILRASKYGSIKLLFPMISGLQELLEAKKIFESVKAELRVENIDFDDKIPIGCMIEVPSAVMICDILARECDFFSIGTNDLIQYTLAVDRSNQKMSYLYRASHPSVVRLLKMVVDGAFRNNIPVSVCGEMAAAPHFTPLLIGLGVNELSVSRPNITKIKETMRSCNIVNASQIAQHVLSLSTPEEIEEYLSKYYELNIKTIANQICRT